MKRMMTALAATAAFSVSPALADHHMEKSGDGEKDMKSAEKEMMSGDKDMMSADKEMKADHKDMMADKKHMMSGDKDMMDKKDWTKAEMDSEVSALKASQVFLAMDEENDGLITKSEWANWQNRSGNTTKQFSDYDMDSDGDIELSEYLKNFDIS
ncbi:hypothetical protein [Henriciella aquimarina]|uniref:hypothetical protein n=1 Tax=Henriciella aquimarina TaxID=545261 RepID=UPI000A007E0D|nr:hypothetical protein [Henriciella aquimarina]